jgi:hypothetical protein
MTPLRRWWAGAFLGTICLAGFFWLFSLLTSSLTETPGHWLTLLFCLGSVLSISAGLITLLGFVIQSPKPRIGPDFWDNINVTWGFIGGFLGLGLLLLRWFQSCYYPGDTTFLVRFWIPFFLIGFAFGAVLDKGVILLFAGFALPFISNYLEPIIGSDLTFFVVGLSLIGMVGIAMYWRFEADRSRQKSLVHFIAYPDDDSLEKLQHWPREAKERLIQNPPPWLAEELTYSEIVEAWLVNDSANYDYRNPFTYGWSLDNESLMLLEPHQESVKPISCFTILLIGFSIITGIFFIMRRLGQKREIK